MPNLKTGHGIVALTMVTLLCTSLPSIGFSQNPFGDSSPLESDIETPYDPGRLSGGFEFKFDNVETSPFRLNAHFQQGIQGIRVTDVIDGGLGAKIGLKRNDIIAKFNGNTVRNIDQYKVVLKVSRSMRLEVVRDGRRIVLPKVLINQAGELLVQKGNNAGARSKNPQPSVGENRNHPKTSSIRSRLVGNWKLQKKKGQVENDGFEQFEFTEFKWNKGTKRQFTRQFGTESEESETLQEQFGTAAQTIDRVEKGDWQLTDLMKDANGFHSGKLILKDRTSGNQREIKINFSKDFSMILLKEDFETSKVFVKR